MTKHEFMKELEELLSDIPLEERKEALSFYEHYFEDAGEEREQEVISELGAPSRVAAGIKANLNSSEQELNSRGYFTEKGYEDESIIEPKYEIIGGMPPVKYNDKYSKEESTDFQTEKDTDNDSFNNSNHNQNAKDLFEMVKSQIGYKNNSNKILLIILGVFAIPILLPILGAILGISIAIIATVVALWFAFGGIGIGLICSGIVAIVAGIIKMFTIPPLGISIAGAGLVLLGVGTLFGLLVIKLSQLGTIVLRCIINICKLPFQKRRVTV